MSSVGFKFMNFAFKVRDLLGSRMDVLKEAGIELGFCFLMNEKDIRARVTNKGLFKPLTKGKKTYRFSKVG
jgi:hypothetical protein